MNTEVPMKCWRDQNGTLVIDIHTSESIHVLQNGETLVQKSRVPPQTFWNADGTQTNDAPMNLRGENQ